MKLLILITVFFILVCLIVFTRWTQPFLQATALYPVYRPLLNGRSVRITKQFTDVCDNFNVSYGTVIDFGCGFGGISYQLSQSGSKVVSVDIAKQSVYPLDHFIQIEKGSKNYAKTIRPGVMEVSATGKVDCALSSYCFHHIPKAEHEGILKDLFSFTSVLVLLEEHPRMNTLCRFVNGEVLTHANAHMTTEEWESHLSKMGYQVDVMPLNNNEFGIVIWSSSA